MSTYQRERLAAETEEEREVRLQCDRQRHRDQQLVQSQLPLFEQHSIRTKMHKFHAHMAMLDGQRVPSVWGVFLARKWNGTTEWKMVNVSSCSKLV